MADGQSGICTIAAAPGYALSTLILDGIDARILVHGRALTLCNVASSHIIEGVFKPAVASPCSAGSDCQSGFCVDGFCCDREPALSGGGSDGCSVTGGGGASGPLAVTPMMLAIFTHRRRRRRRRYATSIPARDFWDNRLL